MADCSIENRLKKLLKDEIKGSATSYRIEDSRVFIPFNPNSRFIKTLEQAVKIAQSKVAAINKKYNPWSGGNVVSTDTTPRNGVYINIHPTQALIDAYEIEEDRKSAEEAEREALTPEQVYQIALSFTEEEIQERLKNCA